MSRRKAVTTENLCQFTAQAFKSNKDIICQAGPEQQNVELECESKTLTECLALLFKKEKRENKITTTKSLILAQDER